MVEKKEQEKLIAQANCLVEFINIDNPNTNDYNVLLFIAKETQKRLKAGAEIHEVKFTSKEILQGVVPYSEETNSSNWLNPIYKKIDDKLRSQIEVPLSSFAAEKSLDGFPWVKKTSTGGGKGHTSKYWLEPQPLLQPSLKRARHFEMKEGQIRYTSVKEVNASLFARLFFGKNLSISGWRKWLMIFYPIISVMLLIIFAYILYLGWFLSPKPITTRDLSSVVSIIVAIWFVKNIKDSVDRFLDDRIIIASEWFMKFRESGVLQEIVTIEDENHNFIRKDV